MSHRLGHRERYLRALGNKDIDRVPIFFRALPPLCQRLKQELGFKTDMELMSYYDSDAIRLQLDYKKRYQEEGFNIPDLSQVDNINQIEELPWQGKDILDIDACIKTAKEAHESGLAVYSGCWSSIFTATRISVGEEKYLMKMALEPEFIHCVVDRMTDDCIEINEAYFQACAKYIDVFYMGSDFGTQRSLFISAEMYRKFFKHNHKRLVDHAKGFELKTMLHTCGAVSELIPDFIDCGIDILDPVQVSAVNMAPCNLEKFKGKIAFHGGISTQKTLPSGSEQDVCEEVISLINALGPHGLIVSPDQDMCDDIPTANIAAMFKSACEYKIQNNQKWTFKGTEHKNG